MPLYMDRHDVRGITAEQVAQAHLLDLAASPRYGVEFLSYWFDGANNAAFCLAKSPSPDEMQAVHRETHGTWVGGGFDLDPRSLAAVKSGDLLLISPEHFLKGAIAGQLQASHAKTGAPLPKGWIYTPGLAITPANVDAVIARQRSQAAKQAWFAPRLNTILTHLTDYLRPLSAVG